MGLTAYLSIELFCSFSHWFTPKSLKLTLEPLQYLCHHPQEPVYVSLPLDTHPFVFLRYRDYIPDRNTFQLVAMSWRVDGKLHLESILEVSSSTLLDS